MERAKTWTLFEKSSFQGFFGAMKISLELIVLKFLLKKGLENEFSREEDLRRFFILGSGGEV